MITNPTLHPYAAALQREWSRARHAPRNLAHVRTWADGDAPFDRCVRSADSLDDIVDLTHRRHVADGYGDDALRRLLSIARTDDLAARIVLERILGALVNASRRYRSFVLDDVLELVTPAAWIAIKTFDQRRTTRHVAAALVSDAVYDTFRRSRRRRWSGEEPTDDDQLLDGVADEPTPDPADELADVLAIAGRTGVEHRHLELLGRLAHVGVADVAAERGVSDRWVRATRERAVAAVRAGLEAA
jgi:DNA-directed RNA polymerase specialized sigma24 family protein